jgi:hypothetical protein
VLLRTSQSTDKKADLPLVHVIDPMELRMLLSQLDVEMD